MKQYQLDGAAIHGISDLYVQLNRELMADEDWSLGETLDGLNDVLYRVESEIRAGAPATLIWEDHRQSREALGFEETQRWLLNKLARPQSFNRQGIQADLDALRNGNAPTYFERVLEVFADHPLLVLELR